MVPGPEQNHWPALDSKAADIDMFTVSRYWHSVYYVGHIVQSHSGQCWTVKKADHFLPGIFFKIFCFHWLNRVYSTHCYIRGGEGKMPRINSPV